MNKFEARQEFCTVRSGFAMLKRVYRSSVTKVLTVMKPPHHHLEQLKFPWIADLLRYW